MSFFGKFKSNANPSSPSIGNAATKKDPNLPQPTALEKHIADISGPIRLDGSDKFFGFENYSSTCYCNSIIQCLYYSAPFRENVINFPYQPPANGSPTPNALSHVDTGPMSTRRSPLTSKPPPTQPGPLASNSPARRPVVLPGSPAAQTQKADDKDSPEYKKKMLMQSGNVLDMQLDYADAYGMDESLFTALKDMFEAIIAHPTRTGIVSPHKFLEILRKENEVFRSAMHQDAHEFLNLVLNQVVDSVELYQKSNPDANKASAALANAMSKAVQGTNATGSGAGWLRDLFEGQLVSETRCLTCENVSQRDEAFMDLSVDLEAHSSVTSCLRKFSEEEMLCERNKFHCDNCGGLQEAEKRMKIKRLPRILALHLKRFKYTEDFNRLQKLFHRVVYPFHLRLFNTTDDAEDPDRLYELYAVVVHIGGGPYHGHYVSIIKTHDRGWLLFDDELVEPVDKNYVQNFFGGEPKPNVQDAKQLACAYVLFYQETTLEAVQREQDADNLATAGATGESFSSVIPTSPTTPGGLWSNGLGHNAMVQTPTDEEKDPFNNLAHAVTAPTMASSIRPPFEPTPTSPLIPSTTTATQKSKKDLKREEKERKVAEKEAEKLAMKKRKEMFEQRRDRFKQAEVELQAAIEASKASAAEEATRAPDTTATAQGADGAPLAQAPTRSSTTGSTLTSTPTQTSSPAMNGKENAAPPSALNRFRHGSMSLRQKPRFWPGGKEKDGASPGSPRLDAPIAEKDEGNGGGKSEDKESKKNRFSLGRKKSSMV